MLAGFIPLEVAGSNPAPATQNGSFRYPLVQGEILDRPARGRAGGLLVEQSHLPVAPPDLAVPYARSWLNG